MRKIHIQFFIIILKILLVSLKILAKSKYCIIKFYQNTGFNFIKSSTQLEVYMVYLILYNLHILDSSPTKIPLSQVFFVGWGVSILLPLLLSLSTNYLESLFKLLLMWEDTQLLKKKQKKNLLSSMCTEFGGTSKSLNSWHKYHYLLKLYITLQVNIIFSAT